MDAENVPSALTSEPKPERIIKKVPGKIPPVPKEKDVAITDLSKKSIADLKELLERQKKILTNKSLVSKLADKGKKASELKVRIEEVLKSRDEVDKTADLLSEMNLSQLNALEWTGHRNPGLRYNNVDEPDNEETNPLKILASHSGTSDQTKLIRVLKTEDSLIKPEDLVDAGDNGSAKSNMASANSDLFISQGISRDASRNEETKQPGSSPSPILQSLLPDEPELFAHFICNRYGHKDTTERFKPNKPLKPFTGTFPFKAPGRVSTKPKRWEETNVTPPPFLHTDSKLLSLEESIDIQRQQNRKLKEIQMKHAAEKLSSFHGIRIAQDIPASVLGSMAHRGQAQSDSEDDLNETELEDQELHDEDQIDRGGTVVYHIES